MKNWTIRRRIILSFGLILALMVVMATVAYTRLQRVKEEAISLETDSLPGLYYSAELMSGWIANYSLVQKHILREDVAAKRKLDTEIRISRDSLAKLQAEYETTISTGRNREDFESFKKLLGGYVSVQDEILQLSLDPKMRAEAIARIETQLDPEFAKVQAAGEAVLEYDKTHSDEASARIMRAVSEAELGVGLSFVVALGLAFICGVVLLRAISRPLAKLNAIVEVMRQGDFTQRLKLDRRDEFGALAEGFNRMTDELVALVGQVQKSGVQVNTSVSEIAATAKQQQTTAIEIASTTTEIGATSREISATSKELVRTMNEVSKVAEHSAALAGSGQAGLNHMEETMHHVMEAAGSINAKLAVLNERAGDISQVVVTITKVADQTNLLSLNAAIEAEKAGEYGRGFAVVATEIRRLADQTAVSTYDIEQIVKAIQSAASAGVMGMDKFSEEVRKGLQEVQLVGGQLSEIIQQVQALAPRFEAVNEAMQAQATGGDQITEALTQLSEAARQTVDSLRQSGLALDGLNEVAVGLRSGVSRFILQT